MQGDIRNMMIDCILQQLDTGRWCGYWHCPQCDPDKKRLLPVNARRNCRNPLEIRQAAAELGIIEKRWWDSSKRPKWLIDPVIQYVQALARWIAAGRPVRSDWEVMSIHAQYCHPCADYDTEREVCTVCGCKARRGGMAVRNKLKMKTEICPLGHWE